MSHPPASHTSVTSYSLILSTINYSYFGPEAMLAYVAGVQRQEIRVGLDCVKHQDMAGSNIGDDHKAPFQNIDGLDEAEKENGFMPNKYRSVQELRSSSKLFGYFGFNFLKQLILKLLLRKFGLVWFG